MKKNSKFFLIIISLLCCNAAFAGLYSNAKNGIDEYKKNNFESAKNSLTSHLNNNPNDKGGFWWLGMTYLKLNDEGMANKNFERAYNLFLEGRNLEKINFSEQAGENIGDYTEMAKAFFEEGNIVEADFYADMILKIDPKSSTALFIKAKVAQLNDNVEQAKTYLSKAIKYENKILKTNLAKSLKITAIPELTEDEYLSFAYELYFRGNVEKSIKYLRKYISLNNQDIEAYNLLAEIYYINNSFDFVRETLEEAKKLGDKNIKTYLIEAKISKEKEEKNLLKAYEINPNNQEVLFALGTYYLEKEDYQEAQKYFLPLMSLNDNYYEAYTGYIFCLIKEGKFDDAVKLIRKLPSMNPNQTEVNILLAEICDLQNNYKEAIDYVNEALKKEENSDYWLKKAQILYTIKKYDESAEILEKIANLPYKVNNVSKFYDLYILNYLKKDDYKNLEKFVTKNLTNLDKNSLTYKYYLYKMYKNSNDVKAKNLQYVKVFGHRPASLSDYINLSEIILDEKGKRSAISFLNSSKRHNKKYSQEFELQKTKIEYLSDNH